MISSSCCRWIWAQDVFLTMRTNAWGFLRHTTEWAEFMVVVLQWRPPSIWSFLESESWFGHSSHTRMVSRGLFTKSWSNITLQWCLYWCDPRDAHARGKCGHGRALHSCRSWVHAAHQCGRAQPCPPEPRNSLPCGGSGSLLFGENSSRMPCLYNTFSYHLLLLFHRLYVAISFRNPCERIFHFQRFHISGFIKPSY